MEITFKKDYNEFVSMNAFLSPAFDLAVDDDLIRKNPCNNIMAKLEKTEKIPKKAMTLEEQRCFLNFLAKSKRFNTYLPLFITTKQQLQLKH